MHYWKNVTIVAGIAIAVGLILFIFLRPPRNMSEDSPDSQPTQSREDRRESPDDTLQRLAPKKREVPWKLNSGGDKSSSPVSPPAPPSFANPVMPARPSQQARSYPEAPPVQPPPLKADSQPLGKDDPIQSIVVEGILTYEMQTQGRVPPEVVAFAPSGDESVFLDGPGGRVRLDFVSPVRFLLQDESHVVVINIFSLQDNSELYRSPVESLKNFDFLYIPFITAYYGSSLKRLLSIEISFSVNGEAIWHVRMDTNFPASAPSTTLKIPASAKQLLEKN